MPIVSARHTFVPYRPAVSLGVLLSRVFVFLFLADVTDTIIQLVFISSGSPGDSGERLYW